jgi:type IV secretory pathway VirB2 component (pilin)
MKNSLISKGKSFLTNNKSAIALCLCALAIGSGFCPVVAHASVESSLSAVQEKLVGTLLPLAAMCGLVIAGLSFVAGHPNARQHLVYAIVGAIVGFGSESIVSFIRNLIH